MRITEEYRQLQKQLHAQGNYGKSGAKHSERIMELCKKLQSKDVLDYGAGQQTLQKSLPFPIQNYDPCIHGLDIDPVPADIVVCSDVMEHIEPACLSKVLDHLHVLTKKILFLDISTRAAQKYLADGRNAHLIQQHHMWWLNQIWPRFDPHSLQTYNGGFVLVATPNELSSEQVRT